MPQISASVNSKVIDAILELTEDAPTIKISFSAMVDSLLSTHPLITKKIQEMSKRKTGKRII